MEKKLDNNNNKKYNEDSKTGKVIARNIEREKGNSKRKFYAYQINSFSLTVLVCR